MKLEINSKAGIRKVLPKVAQDLADNKIVGWFQNGSEFGPRALGFRSILANPAMPDVKKYINEKIKHREWWRPYAPVIIDEEAAKWFDMKRSSPYMLFSAKATEMCKEKAPGIVHEDGTARIQTVCESDNRTLYVLLKMFFEKTDIPMLLNTSFNIDGEPIVETPSDAVKTFKKSNIDILVMGDIYVREEGV